MTNPIPIYVSVVTARELNREYVKIWLDTATGYLPDGIVTTTQAPDGKSGIRVVKQKSSTGFAYFIPLTRHLTEEEAEAVVVTFGDRVPNLDYDVVVSKNHTEFADEPAAIKIEAEKYKAICVSFAKRQHEQWVRDRTNAGWRFDTRMNAAEKTHPMLRSWDELPEQLRQIDYTQPQSFVDLLNDQGYAVVSREELSGIYKLLRNNL